MDDDCSRSGVEAHLFSIATSLQILRGDELKEENTIHISLQPSATLYNHSRPSLSLALLLARALSRLVSVLRTHPFLTASRSWTALQYYSTSR